MLSQGDDTFADYESPAEDFDPATILQNVAKEAAKKRKVVSKTTRNKIPRLGLTFPTSTHVSTPMARPGTVESSSEEEEESRGQSNKALLRRIQQLEAQAQPAVDYKKKYEELLQSTTGAVSTIVPSEPPPNAGLVKGTWQEDGRDPVSIRDNDMFTL